LENKEGGNYDDIREKRQFSLDKKESTAKGLRTGTPEITTGRPGTILREKSLQSSRWRPTGGGKGGSRVIGFRHTRSVLSDYVGPIVTSNLEKAEGDGRLVGRRAGEGVLFLENIELVRSSRGQRSNLGKKGAEAWARRKAIPYSFRR